MTVLAFDVVGIPAPQGSKKGFYNPKLGRVQMVESSKKVKPWRQDVSAAAERAVDAERWDHEGKPVRLTVTFYLPRPKGHFGTGRNAHTLRPTAPRYPASKPDGDKLLRSTCDALTTAGCVQDDARIVEFSVWKRYADRTRPGAHIQIELLDQQRRPEIPDPELGLPRGSQLETVPVQEALL